MKKEFKRSFNHNSSSDRLAYFNTAKVEWFFNFPLKLKQLIIKILKDLFLKN